MKQDWTFCSLLKNKLGSKPPTRDAEGGNDIRGRAYHLSEDSANGQQDYYAFAVGAGRPTGGSEVDLKE